MPSNNKLREKLREGVRKRIVKFMLRTIGDRRKTIDGQEIKSRVDFANAVGQYPNTMSRWESGDANPTTEDIAVICGLFDVSADLFFKGGEDSPEKRIEALERELDVLKKSVEVVERMLNVKK